MPEVLGDGAATFRRDPEYLFISLFRACAESLALTRPPGGDANGRKYIDELLVNLKSSFHHLRAAIDEELFDVISGFEALSLEKLHDAQRRFSYVPILRPWTKDPPVSLSALLAAGHAGNVVRLHPNGETDYARDDEVFRDARHRQGRRDG